MVVTAAEMARLRVVWELPRALVAVISTSEVPAAVGVPVMAPLVALSVNPAGNPVVLKLVGVLVAAMVYEKAAPVVPMTWTGG